MGKFYMITTKINKPCRQGSRTENIDNTSNN